MKRNRFDIAKEDSIVAVIKFVINNDEAAKNEAISALTQLAKEYHLTNVLKLKEEKKTVLECLLRLVSIDYPLCETINSLINSIKCNNI